MVLRFVTRCSAAIYSVAALFTFFWCFYEIITFKSFDSGDIDRITKQWGWDAEVQNHGTHHAAFYQKLFTNLFEPFVRSELLKTAVCLLLKIAAANVLYRGTTNKLHLLETRFVPLMSVTLTLGLAMLLNIFFIGIKNAFALCAGFHIFNFGILYAIVEIVLLVMAFLYTTKIRYPNVDFI